jgi:hypothetical protein
LTYSPAVSDDEVLPLSARLWFAVVCAFRVLFDGGFAWRAWQVRDRMPALPAPVAAPAPAAAKKEKKEKVKQERDDAPGALLLLSLFQREGRLVDFLQQDITSFDDADVGAAARVVHEGCKKALLGHGKVAPVRSEAEESRVSVDSGVDTGAVKLTGNVSGKPPYRGVLRHRGWRIEELKLPKVVANHDLTVIAPAEVEL